MPRTCSGSAVRAASARCRRCSARAQLTAPAIAVATDVLCEINFKFRLSPTGRAVRAALLSGEAGGGRVGDPVIAAALEARELSAAAALFSDQLAAWSGSGDLGVSL